MSDSGWDSSPRVVAVPTPRPRREGSGRRSPVRLSRPATGASRPPNTTAAAAAAGTTRRRPRTQSAGGPPVRARSPRLRPGTPADDDAGGLQPVPPPAGRPGAQTRQGERRGGSGLASRSRPTTTGSRATTAQGVRSAAVGFEVRLREIEAMARAPAGPVVGQVAPAFDLLRDLAAASGSYQPVLLGLHELFMRLVVSDTEYTSSGSTTGAGSGGLAGQEEAVALPHFEAVARLLEEREVMNQKRVQLESEVERAMSERNKAVAAQQEAREIARRATNGQAQAEDKAASLETAVSMANESRDASRADTREHIVALHRELSALKAVHSREMEELHTLRAFRDKMEGMRKVFLDMEHTRRLNETEADARKSHRFGPKRGLAKISDLSRVTEMDLQPVRTDSIERAVENAATLEAELLVALNVRLEDYEHAIENLDDAARKRVRKKFAADGRELVSEATKLRAHIKKLMSSDEWLERPTIGGGVVHSYETGTLPKGPLWSVFASWGGEMPRLERRMTKERLLFVISDILQRKRNREDMEMFALVGDEAEDDDATGGFAGPVREVAFAKEGLHAIFAQPDARPLTADTTATGAESDPDETHYWTDSLGDFVHEYLNNLYGDTSIALHSAYSIIHATSDFGPDDAFIDFFGRCVGRELSNSAWRYLATMEVVIKGLGVRSKMADNQDGMLYVINTLYGGPTMPGNVYRYADSFKAQLDGDYSAGSFVRALAMQILSDKEPRILFWSHALMAHDFSGINALRLLDFLNAVVDKVPTAPRAMIAHVYDGAKRQLGLAGKDPVPISHLKYIGALIEVYYRSECNAARRQLRNRLKMLGKLKKRPVES